MRCFAFSGSQGHLRTGHLTGGLGKILKRYVFFTYYIALSDGIKKWDAYLAEYSTTLPNAHDRAGNFIPLQSRWKRLLRTLHITSSSPTSPQEIIFPSDADFSTKVDYSSIPRVSSDEKPAAHLSRESLQRSVSPEAYKWQPSSATKGVKLLQKSKSRSGGGFKRVRLIGDSQSELDNEVLDLAHGGAYLKKARSARMGKRQIDLPDKKRRARLEFRPKDGFSSESSSEDPSDGDELKKPPASLEIRTETRMSPLVRVDSVATTLSGTTVHPSSGSAHGPGSLHEHGEMDVESEKTRLISMKATFGGDTRTMKPAGEVPEYSDVEEDVINDFIRSGQRTRSYSPGWKPEFIKHAFPSGKPGTFGNERLSSEQPSSAPVRAVPVTPSLVFALGRIAKAQVDAYGPSLKTDGPDNSPVTHHDPPVTQRDHISVSIDAHTPVVGLPVVGEDRRSDRDNRERWDKFWNEVQVKAEGS